LISYPTSTTLPSGEGNNAAFGATSRPSFTTVSGINQTLSLTIFSRSSEKPTTFNQRPMDGSIFSPRVYAVTFHAPVSRYPSPILSRPLASTQIFTFSGFVLFGFDFARGGATRESFACARADVHNLHQVRRGQ
jgi:hypothetical protein